MLQRASPIKRGSGPPQRIVAQDSSEEEEGEEEEDVELSLVREDSPGSDW